MEATRTATYTGKPAVLTQKDGETRAQVLGVILAKESRTLDRLTGKSSVRMITPEGWLAEGEDLLYEAPQDVYILQGTPLKLTTRDADKCTIQTGNYMRYDGAVNAAEFPRAENPGGAPSESGRPCPPGMPPARPASPAKK